MTAGTERTAGSAKAEGSAGRWGSALDSVVVYAQGALCRRLARGVVPPDGRVRVTGLPRALDPGSLRARVLGAPGARVAEARVEIEAVPRTSASDASDASEASAAFDASDALRREVDRLRDAFEAAEGRRDRQRSLIAEVEALRPVPPGRKREDPRHRPAPVESWLELVDFVDERLTGLHARLAVLDEELLRAERDLFAAADRLDRSSTDASSPHVDTAVCALLTLVGTDGAPAELEIEVEYGVPGARWVPAYRLDHRQGEETGRLVLRASVAQRTGEDWTGVRLALATADPHRRTEQPKLRSIRIGRRQEPPAPSGWREPPAGLADLFTGYDAMGPHPRAGTPVGPGPAPGLVGAPTGYEPSPGAYDPAPASYGFAPEPSAGPGDRQEGSAEYGGRQEAPVPPPAPAGPARSRSA
ncbi:MULTISPECIES: DUF4139 domain-containing protein, partial [unclassified Streptomyces]|uniref:DUF4139 domain-containing protein n=1 Tax=unclassified Streptomyces TaxID=2593676 RepID=UPI001661841D